jgi:hypothetical protein
MIGFAMDSWITLHIVKSPVHEAASCWRISPLAWNLAGFSE